MRLVHNVIELVFQSIAPQEAAGIVRSFSEASGGTKVVTLNGETIREPSSPVDTDLSIANGINGEAEFVLDVKLPFVNINGFIIPNVYVFVFRFTPGNADVEVSFVLEETVSNMIEASTMVQRLQEKAIEVATEFPSASNYYSGLEPAVDEDMRFFTRMEPGPLRIIDLPHSLNWEGKLWAYDLGASYADLAAPSWSAHLVVHPKTKTLVAPWHHTMRPVSNLIELIFPGVHPREAGGIVGSFRAIASRALIIKLNGDVNAEAAQLIDDDALIEEKIFEYGEFDLNVQSEFLQVREFFFPNTQISIIKVCQGCADIEVNFVLEEAVADQNQARVMIERLQDIATEVASRFASAKKYYCGLDPACDEDMRFFTGVKPGPLRIIDLPHSFHWKGKFPFVSSFSRQ